MNLIELQNSLRERVRAVAAEKFGVELAQVPSEVPPRTELGDLAFPVAFELAKRIKQATGEKRNPRAIAEELKRELESVEGVARVEVAGAGYLNLFFARARMLSMLAKPDANTAGVAQVSEPDQRPKRGRAPQGRRKFAEDAPQPAALLRGHGRAPDSFIRSKACDQRKCRTSDSRGRRSYVTPSRRIVSRWKLTTRVAT